MLQIWATRDLEATKEMGKTKEVLLILQIILLIWILRDNRFNRKHVLPQVQPQTTAPNIKTINKLTLMAKYNLSIWDLLGEHILRINLIHMKGMKKYNYFHSNFVIYLYYFRKTDKLSSLPIYYYRTMYT